MISNKDLDEVQFMLAYDAHILSEKNEEVRRKNMMRNLKSINDRITETANQGKFEYTFGCEVQDKWCDQITKFLISHGYSVSKVPTGGFQVRW